MNLKVLVCTLSALSISLFAQSNDDVQLKINQLQSQAVSLQKELQQLQLQLKQQAAAPVKVKSTPSVQVKSTPPARKNLHKTSTTSAPKRHPTLKKMLPKASMSASGFHESTVVTREPDMHPEPLLYYPTALMADNEVITYIAGTPVVTTPYLGSRPAFDGSDYIVNISSINRDVRLMQQRRNLYHGYAKLGYPTPTLPILALSGKIQPLAFLRKPYTGRTTGDLTLNTSELDVTAILNEDVEGFMSIAFDGAPPPNGPRIGNSRLRLNMGFVNIGNLEKTPFYATVGQLYAPFGRYSSAMVTPTLPMLMFRTKTRPFIFGYKSQTDTGPFAAIYAFKSDTTLGHSGVGGLNAGYIFNLNKAIGEVGAGFISSVNDAAGMQFNDSVPYTTFGGFGSATNGNEAVAKKPAIDLHGNVSYDRFSLTAEWASMTESFRVEDLSYNGRSAKPQAGQIEAGVTFRSFDKPASISAGYQYSRQALALNLPEQSINAVYNISIWKDTVESLEYRHDIGYGSNTYANGAAPVDVVNQNTVGTGRNADTVLAQIGIFF